MTDPFVAEIRIFGFAFAPKGWAACDGQLLPIPQNTALFSLLLTTYGGDGVSTFALPDLQGRAPLHAGQGPGLTSRPLGAPGGQDAVVLDESQLPSHDHGLLGHKTAATAGTPATKDALANSVGGDAYRGDGASQVAMSRKVIRRSGGDQGHNNMQPYLTLSFCIALQGVYPSRT